MMLCVFIRLQTNNFLITLEMLQQEFLIIQRNKARLLTKKAVMLTLREGQVVHLFVF